MRNNIVGFASLFIAILVSGCNAFSEPKDGLSYEEYINGAQQYVDKGDGERAIPYYKKALKIKPEDAQGCGVRLEILKDMDVTDFRAG